MTIFHVGALEAIYITINLACLGLTMFALSEAIHDYRAVKKLNGKAREIASRGDIRREGFRIVVNVLFLSIALPAALSDRETTLSHVVVVLMAVPLVLLASSYFDLRERRRLITLIARETAR